MFKSAGKLLTLERRSVLNFFEIFGRLFELYLSQGQKLVDSARYVPEQESKQEASDIAALAKRQRNKRVQKSPSASAKGQKKCIAPNASVATKSVAPTKKPRPGKPANKSACSDQSDESEESSCSESSDAPIVRSKNRKAAPRAVTFASSSAITTPPVALSIAAPIPTTAIVKFVGNPVPLTAAPTATEEMLQKKLDEMSAAFLEIKNEMKKTLEEKKPRSRSRSRSRERRQRRRDSSRSPPPSVSPSPSPTKSARYRRSESPERGPCAPPSQYTSPTQWDLQVPVQPMSVQPMMPSMMQSWMPSMMPQLPLMDPLQQMQQQMQQQIQQQFQLQQQLQQQQLQQQMQRHYQHQMQPHQMQHLQPKYKKQKHSQNPFPF
jgi:hypothetical protein